MGGSYAVVDGPEHPYHCSAGLVSKIVQNLYSSGKGAALNRWACPGQLVYSSSSIHGGNAATIRSLSLTLFALRCLQGLEGASRHCGILYGLGVDGNNDWNKGGQDNGT